MSFQVVTLTLLRGFGQTCKVFFLVLAGSLPLGLLISFGSMSKLAPIRWLVKTFVWIIRGTPLMLQLMIVFYGPGLMFGGRSLFDRLSAILVAFIINYAAYFSEIYRSGIQSVPHGQYEAGLVLGMTKTQIFVRITLLQVIKRILPPMSNEIITLVKDTSIARIIAFSEIIMAGFTYTTKGIIWPLFYTGVFYLIFIGILTILFNYIERRLGYFKV